MQQIVSDYLPVVAIKNHKQVPMGTSSSPKGMIFHVLNDNSEGTSVLDIGFGAGGLGELIKQTSATAHWEIDGIEGWEVNCHNQDLINKRIYKNIWNGLAQELPSEILCKYKIICLLDVIEHLNIETSKWLLRTLLTFMGEDSYLFISTPLWFYPQHQNQDGDLEEHLIGVPASSMMALLPIMYAINDPLVGGFVYGKKSLNYVEFFQPISNKNFSYEMGLNILKSLNIQSNPGVVYKTNL
jgi:2-polyprenyl-3-methyl-5-hydroxy-6-metoxy-1,4-benzoquinol methylase